jgi:hypothetical protein
VSNTETGMFFCMLVNVIEWWVVLQDNAGAATTVPVA